MYSWQLQLKALQTLATIFQCPEQSVAVPFIHALAPDVLVLLNDKCLRKPASTPELDVCTAAVKILQILLDSTQDTFRKYPFLLTLSFVFICCVLALVTVVVTGQLVTMSRNDNKFGSCDKILILYMRCMKLHATNGIIK